MSHGVKSNEAFPFVGKAWTQVLTGYCSTSLCVVYKSLLIHDIQVLIYRGSTNERLSGEGVAYDSYYNETDRVIPPFL